MTFRVKTLESVGVIWGEDMDISLSYCNNFLYNGSFFVEYYGFYLVLMFSINILMLLLSLGGLLGDI